MLISNGMVKALTICAMLGLSTMACNTIGGMGEDIRHGGDAIDNAAEEVHDDIHRNDQSKNYDRYDQPGVHTISAWSDPGGSIQPEGDITGSHGSDQTFIISALPGYHVADVLIDGVSVGARNRYTFDNMNANHSISAIFTTNPVR